MLRPARILPALAFFAAALSAPLTSHAIEQPCPQNPQTEGFVAPTAGTKYAINGWMRSKRRGRAGFNLV